MKKILLLLLLSPAAILKAQSLPEAYFRYDSVQVKPVYPGGEPAMHDYLSNNLKRPQADSLHGKAKVWFIVEKNGELSNIRVRNGLGGEYDRLAERLIREMPAWVAGEHLGNKVAVAVEIEVVF